MSESLAIGAGAASAPVRRPPERLARLAVRTACLGFFAGNLVAIVWIWLANHNLDFTMTRDTTAAVLTRAGGLAGLLGAYLALVQVLLLARLPGLDRLAGFDRLTVWHRWNGFACIALVAAHVALDVEGPALDLGRSFGGELWGMLAGNLFQGMITATVGTALLLAVGASSLVVARRALPYELWYAIHLSAYAGIALAWFHQIPVGGDLALSPRASDYWRALFYATIAALAVRVLAPVASALRYRMRVSEVVAESPDVVSLRITGRRLERLGARPGQFFIWRFLARGHWWSAHPFSLSAAPDGRSLRISVKASGDHTSRMAGIRVGTRVVAEGPFGDFTALARRRAKVLLLAGGIGITPVRALAEELEGDVVIIHRIRSEEDVVFAHELPQIARARGLALEYVVGDHADAGGRDLLSPAHLRELVPDLSERDVYLCGPPAMVETIAASLRRAGVSRRALHVERFAL